MQDVEDVTKINRDPLTTQHLHPGYNSTVLISWTSPLCHNTKI